MSLSVEVVGHGLRGAAHVKALANNPDFSVVGWRDLVRERSRPASSKADLVVVATPNATHYGLVEEALQKGQHVVCEKPLTLVGREAMELSGLARSRGLLLRTAYQLRYYPGLQLLRYQLREGELGDLRSVVLEYGSKRSPGFVDSWRTDATVAGGGVLVDQGTHVIDLADWMFGRLSFQSAEFSGEPVEFTARLGLAALGGGAPIEILASWERWAAHFSIALIGTKGSAWLEGLGGKYAEQRLLVEDTHSSTHGPWRFDAEAALQAAWADIWEELEGRPHTGDDGVCPVAVTEAAYNARP